MTNYNKIGKTNFYQENQAPSFTGIDYDPTIPNNMIVATPGGVSTTYNHYTHGMYGMGDLTSDIYGWQGYRNISGPYNNMYTQGYDGATASGMYPPSRDPNFRENFTPTSVYQNNMFNTSAVSNSQDMYKEYYGGTEYYGNTNNAPLPSSVPINLEQIGQTIIMDDVKSTPVESYQMINNKDELSPEEKDKIKEFISSIRVSINPIALFVLLIIGSIVFGLWYDTINKYIKDHFHGGSDLTIKQYALWAILFSLVFVILLHIFGVSLVNIETI